MSGADFGGRAELHKLVVEVRDASAPSVVLLVSFLGRFAPTCMLTGRRVVVLLR